MVHLVQLLVGHLVYLDAMVDALEIAQQLAEGVNLAQVHALMDVKADAKAALDAEDHVLQIVPEDVPEDVLITVGDALDAERVLVDVAEHVVLDVIVVLGVLDAQVHAMVDVAVVIQAALVRAGHLVMLGVLGVTDVLIVVPDVEQDVQKHVLVVAQ